MLVDKRKNTVLLALKAFCWFLLSSLFFMSGEVLAADQGWQFVEEREGVALYRAAEEAEGLLPFKAVAELAVAHEKVVMALVDAERKASWAPKLKGTEIHQEISSNRFLYSEYYETPWPFKDREFLLLGDVSYTREGIVFSAVTAEDKELARKDHLLANIEELTFVVTPLGPDRTRVALTFSGDMGGWIPAFVKTIIQKRWPVRFIAALDLYLAKEDHSLVTRRYQGLLKNSLPLSGG